jgi:hypothetical protein
MILNTRDFVQAGALMSYGPSFPALFRRAAEFVDKILRGAKPGDIPVEQPTKFELVINLTTAKGLGLTIPEAFLLRANELIEYRCCLLHCISPVVGHSVELLRCEGSDAIGAKRTFRERRKRVDLTKMTLNRHKREYFAAVHSVPVVQ